jgi:hypothetical protein
MTLAMFMLVVFTLVVGAVTTNAFTNAYDDVEIYGGGFDIRAETVRVNPVADMRAAVDSASGLNAEEFEVIAAQSSSLRRLAKSARKTSSPTIRCVAWTTRSSMLLRMGWRRSATDTTRRKRSGRH